MDSAALVVVLVVVVMLAAGIAFAVLRRSRPAPSGRTDRVIADSPAALRERLERTRKALAGRLAALSARPTVDDAFWSEAEDLLVAADVGVTTAADLVTSARVGGPEDVDAARDALLSELEDLFEGRDRALHLGGHPAVVLVVGVNGGGKTTTIAKLAHALLEDGATVLLGAADTFRAAAGEQLETWADRLGVDVVSGQRGADAAAVAFDAYEAARARGADTVIVDTAGRLQTRTDLMTELGKVARVLGRTAGDVDEVLLVIDGTTGQNAIAQAQSFAEAVGVTGIVITKLDGTSRGGAAVAIERELDIPVKFIGVGEGVQDLVPFDPASFVDALLGS